MVVGLGFDQELGLAFELVFVLVLELPVAYCTCRQVDYSPGVSPPTLALADLELTATHVKAESKTGLRPQLKVTVAIVGLRPVLFTYIKVRILIGKNIDNASETSPKDVDRNIKAICPSTVALRTLEPKPGHPPSTTNRIRYPT